MSAEFFAFGEILWDCLPSGRHAGGAPFNVAAHLAQLDCSVALVSSVGQDPLGDELLQVAVEKGVDTQFITRARTGIPTGTVNVTVDVNGNATYDIVQPVAWDEIRVPQGVADAVAQSRAFVFGSLAGRSRYNVEQLDKLLALPGPVKFFDVNLRPPFADPTLVLDLARRADVIKLNDDEVGLLAAWLRTGAMSAGTPRDAQSLRDACARVAEETATGRICVTRGPDGAAFWESGRLTCVPAPRVEVRDTVGAGDAFMAGLMRGLTSGVEVHRVLESACRLGAFVASQHGATPILPEELRALFGNASARA
jgi:fructokinase